MGTTREQTTTSDVVSIRFQKLGKLYHFRLGRDYEDYALSDHVIVETRRGRQLGQIIEFVEDDDAKQRRGLRTVERKANPRDLVMQQVWQSKELETLITTREKAHELKVVDAKFIKATFNYDGSWVTVAYTTENKQLDLRALQTALSRSFKARVEMRLIGPRDVARILGGYGACGGPRCCSTFLTEFSPVSIRMAKAQGISLSPNEITGMCGRLRCCLVFEYEQYVEAKKHLPRIKAKVGTPFGEGYVSDVLVLRDAVLVDVRGEFHEVAREDLEPLKELKALKEKAAAGCSKHEEGGCDCGSKPA
jgi:cell fate regulator YaaT (PSP1 superfamily)